MRDAALRWSNVVRLHLGALRQTICRLQIRPERRCFEHYAAYCFEHYAAYWRESCCERLLDLQLTDSHKNLWRPHHDPDHPDD